MAQKRYQLSLHGKEFATGGLFKFRVAFEILKENNNKVYKGQKECPIITIGENDIIGTTNELAQSMISTMEAPVNSKRNGQTKVVSGSLIFEDVTVSTVSGDVDEDLDVNFSA